MATFTYNSDNVRAVVTYTSGSPKDLEIQIDYQRFKFGEVSSYNFPASPNGSLRNNIPVSAFLASDPEKAVEIQQICSGEIEELLGVYVQNSEEKREGEIRLPDAYILLVPYK